VEHTTSRPRRSKPIERVELQITFKADEAEAARIKAEYPSAKRSGGSVRVVIAGDDPLAVAEMARDLAEKVKRASSQPRV
jgi:hypothetical protein